MFVKRLFAALLAVLLLFSLCACTEDQGGGTTTMPTTTSTPSVTDPTDSSTGDSTTSTTIEDVLDDITDRITSTEHDGGVTTYTMTDSTDPVVPTKPLTTTKPIVPSSSSDRTTAKTTKSTKGTTKKPTVITTKATTTTKPAPIPTVVTTTTTTQKSSQGASKTTTTTKKEFVYKYTTGQTHTPVALEERYYYSLMDEEWKGYYRQIDAAVRNMDEGVEFPIQIGEDRRYALFFLYQADHPEISYLYNTMSIHSHGDGTSALKFCYFVSIKEGEISGYGHGELTPALKQKCLDKQATFDKAVKAITSTIPSDAPAVAKERMLYEKILLGSHYNLGAMQEGEETIRDNWMAYGVLVKGYGVCESYSKAFVTLCQAMGIPATEITGTAGGGHMWNAVKLDGEWYQCDITFDDPIGGDPNEAYFHFFNLTDAQMKEHDHVWTKSLQDEGYFKAFGYPKCTATKYSYKNVVALYGE